VLVHAEGNLMLTANVIGNLGSDAEIKYSQAGAPILRCNVAANFRAKSADGEWEERTEWVQVSLFGTRGESLSRFLTKGTKVYVSGRLEARPWTAQDGSIRAGLEIVADNIELCSSRPAEDGQQARPTNTVNRQPVAVGGRQQGADDDDLENLPF
jgi:single-strand DNA-binding protein